MPNRNTPEWLKEAVFYQIFPDRFANGNPANDPPGVAPWGSTPTRDNFCGGDLQGIIDHLPYLESLGVNALYLTPIFQARSNHKYDTCDYRAIDPAFGDLAVLQHLVDLCHERGMHVVLDAVFNHCGDGFWAFTDLVQKGEASPYRDWFFTTGFPIQAEPPNYQTCGGASILPKLNLENPQVREYLFAAARYWMDQARIDGWRLDVPWKAPLSFWREFRSLVKQLNPQAYIAGEVWRDPEPWLAGDTCDGIMNYPLREAILDYCVRDTMDAEDFNHVTTRLLEMYGEAAASQLNLIGSHDTARLLTLCQGDIDRAILAAVAQFTAVGIPMIYYGDEIGLQGENDPGCRACMPWDETAWNQSLREIYQVLIRARKEHPALRIGGLKPIWVFNGVYVYLRCWEEDQVIIILNPRQARANVAIPLDGQITLENDWWDLLSGTRFTVSDRGLWIKDIPAKSAFILVRDHPEHSVR